MSSVESTKLSYAQIDAILSHWRQGDCALNNQYFLHVFDSENPISQEALALDEKNYIVEYNVKGLVIVSQTCDIVRPCKKRHFIEVAPLIEVNPKMWHEISRGRRPAFAFIPSLKEKNLVADLDRFMTVEKPVVAKWKRTPGCSTDEEIRNFSDALKRKHGRFPFPDEMKECVEGLENLIHEKHDRESPEGNALRSLREVRIHPVNGWQSLPTGLFFWFIKKDGVGSSNTSYDQFLEKWLNYLNKTEIFPEISGVVTSLEDMTAKDYIESDRLDLDHLSTRL